MKKYARVVVIGGGVVGVSTLYHLTKKGWSDVVLLERKELTSGSTWHAAGLLPLFNLSYSVGQLHRYSVKLYKTLQAETEQDVGFRGVSNIRLACTPDRMDEYRYYAGIAETLGVNVRFLTPSQLEEIWPLAKMEGILGAIQHPDDGYIQPADLTQALARGARNGGGEIYRNTTVLGIEQKPSGEWLVKSDQGDITCEHIVSCTGNFARKTGEMVGLDIPSSPSNTNISSPNRTPPFSSAVPRACRKWACCANPTPPITCVRKMVACFSALTKPAPRAVMSMALRPTASTSCFRKISTA